MADCIRGLDEKDETYVAVKELPFNGISEVKIGIPVELMPEDMTIDQKIAMEKVLRKLKNHFSVQFISIESLKKSLDVYYKLSCFEAASSLARYKKICRNDPFQWTNEYEFGPSVQQRISMASSIDYSLYESIRHELIRDFEEAFRNCNILLSPTFIGEIPVVDRVVDRQQEWKLDLMTVPANLARISAISMPIDSHNSIQLMAPRLHDLQLLKVTKLVLSLLQ